MVSRRDRLAITLGGAWRLYQHQAPHGWYMLGTVQSGMEIGALGRSPAGLLAQINAGAVRALDQRKAQAALQTAQ